MSPSTTSRPGFARRALAPVTPRWSRLRVLVVLVLVIVLAGAAGWAVLESTLLSVRTVEVTGTSRVTPAEVLAAADGGIAKLFPAHAVGPRYLRSVLAVAPPGTRVVPTGGIALDDVAAWLDAGAYAVGIGSELAPGPESAERLAALRGAVAA